MAIPGSNIRLSGDIAVELQFAIGSVMKISDVYAVSQSAGTVSSGSYHNLTIGSGAGNTFANLIYVPYASTSDLKLENWVNYDHQRNHIFSFDVTNNSPNDYDVIFYLSTTPGAHSYSFGSWSFPGGGTNINQQDYNTGINAYNFSGTPADPYFVDCEVIYTGGPMVPGILLTVNTSSDTDNVGAGTARIDYTMANGPYNLAPITGTDFKDCLISGSGSFKSTAIPWNKRTSVTMVIQ